MIFLQPSPKSNDQGWSGFLKQSDVTALNVVIEHKLQDAK